MDQPPEDLGESRGAATRKLLTTIIGTLEITNVMAAMMMFATAFSAYATWKTAQVTNEILLTSQRPYIGVESIKFDNGGSANPRVVVDLRNFGSVQAENALISLRLGLDGRPLSGDSEQQTKRAQGRGGQKPQEDYCGQTQRATAKTWAPQQRVSAAISSIRARFGKGAIGLGMIGIMAGSLDDSGWYRPARTFTPPARNRGFVWIPRCRSCQNASAAQIQRPFFKKSKFALQNGMRPVKIAA
jgi:hypothetical protein